MFETGWGFQEIILVLVIALIVVGPERLPDLARKAGKWFAKIRNFVTDVKDDIDREIAADELKKILKEQVDSSGVHEIIEETKQTFSDVENEYLVNALTDNDSDQKKVQDSSKVPDKSLAGSESESDKSVSKKVEKNAVNSGSKNQTVTEKQDSQLTDNVRSAEQKESADSDSANASTPVSDPNKKSNSIS